MHCETHQRLHAVSFHLCDFLKMTKPHRSVVARVWEEREGTVVGHKGTLWVGGSVLYLDTVVVATECTHL